MLVLLGVAVVVVGFALRLNPMLVVTVAGLVTGLLGGLSPKEILDAFGTGFAGSRSIVIFLLVLPVIGLVERNGLQEQSRRLIERMARLTTGRVMALYLFVRQATCAIGLLSIGGHAQSVRPIVAPMAEAAAVKRHGPLPERVSQRIRAFAAGTDNVGAFFGEDIFVAVGAVLLITSFVDTTYDLTLRPAGRRALGHPDRGLPRCSSTASAACAWTGSSSASSARARRASRPRRTAPTTSRP